MVIDSSVLLAIFLQEPEENHFLALIAAAPRRIISTATLLETHIVLESRVGPSAKSKLDQFIDAAAIESIAFDSVQLEIARSAFSSYGKGRHPARLNFGDCFTYALAKVSGEPIFAKGDDFKRTDSVLL